MAINISTPSKSEQSSPRITVFGVGGAGCNAVKNMIDMSLQKVEYVMVNTDMQPLREYESKCPNILPIGSNTTRGLGAGADPEVGAKAAEESAEQIVEYLKGNDMVFITAGMGGGTGTGAAPIISKLSREQGILTVGVVTKPFLFEGKYRMQLAESGLEKMYKTVDTLIIIPNQNLFLIADQNTTFANAFKLADNILYTGVRSITDLILMAGLINLDFADIRSVMSNMGKAMMGTGEASGENRAVKAAESAISNPLLYYSSMRGAKGVLVNITGGTDMTLFEVDAAASRIRDEVDPNANIIFGSAFSDDMEGKIRVSVVATGINEDNQDSDADSEGITQNFRKQYGFANVAAKPHRDENINRIEQSPAPRKHEPGHVNSNRQIRKNEELLGQEGAYKRRSDLPMSSNIMTKINNNNQNKEREKVTVEASGKEKWLDIPAFLRKTKRNNNNN